LPLPKESIVLAALSENASRRNAGGWRLLRYLATAGAIPVLATLVVAQILSKTFAPSAPASALIRAETVNQLERLAEPLP